MTDAPVRPSSTLSTLSRCLAGIAVTLLALACSTTRTRPIEIDAAVLPAGSPDAQDVPDAQTARILTLSGCKPRTEPDPDPQAVYFGASPKSDGSISLILVAGPRAETDLNVFPPSGSPWQYRRDPNGRWRTEFFRIYETSGMWRIRRLSDNSEKRILVGRGWSVGSARSSLQLRIGPDFETGASKEAMLIGLGAGDGFAALQLSDY